MFAAAANKNKLNSLLVSKKAIHDNSVISLSASRMEALSLHRGDAVFVKGRSPKGTVLIATDDRSLDDKQACITAIVRRNLSIRLGDSISISICSDIKYARRIAVLPVADTIKDFKGSLFDVFLAPYFREAFRPVRQGDFFTCRSAIRQVEFKVVEVDGPEYGIVASNTVIHCEGEAIPREPKNSAQFTAYEDIGGCGRQLDEIYELVNMRLKYPELYYTTGIEPTDGILLHGPPGTGKTHIARAISNETGVFFFLINGPEVLASEPGKSEANLRTAFEEAEKHAPSILFIDELDAIAPKRDKASDALERRLVSQLMTLMDGVKVRSDVIVMAASNRPDAIDPSLRRYGRFEREIKIGVPDLAGRLEILKIHTKRMTPADDVDLGAVAAATEGYVGADIAGVCAEAALREIRGKTDLIDFERETVRLDVLRSLRITQRDFLDAVAAYTPSARREGAAVDLTVERSTGL